MLATADADGIPNVTYLSCAHVVDGERIALSNQFFSKTARNIMENPRASLLLIDPRDYRQYRRHAAYERTDRHGPAFEALRRDVDTVAALQGMQDVFRLRAADVYRVLRVERAARGRRLDRRCTGVGGHRDRRPGGDRRAQHAPRARAGPRHARRHGAARASTSCSGSGTRS